MCTGRSPCWPTSSTGCCSSTSRRWWTTTAGAGASRAAANSPDPSARSGPMPLADLLTAERIVMLTEPGDRDRVLDAAARLLTDASPAMTAAIGAALRERESLGKIGRAHV